MGNFWDYLNKSKQLSESDILREVPGPKPSVSRNIINSYLNNKNLIGLNPETGGIIGKKAVAELIKLIKEAGITVPQISGISSVYLSGPMSKYPFANYTAFYFAEAILRLAGISTFVNPATIKHEAGSGWVNFMRNDVVGMLQTDRLIMIKGFEASLGARVEKAIAENIQNIKAVMRGAVQEETAEYEKRIGSVDTAMVQGKDREIFESESFKRIMKHIEQSAQMPPEPDSNAPSAVEEIFEADHVFQAVKRAPNNFSIVTFDELMKGAEKQIYIDLSKHIEQTYPNLISRNESILPKYLKRRYLEQSIGNVISIFDIDDTLFKTISQIKYKDQSWSSHEFAIARTFIPKDAALDFTDFKDSNKNKEAIAHSSSVPEGISKLMAAFMQGHEIGILTARGGEDGIYKGLMQKLPAVLGFDPEKFKRENVIAINTQQRQTQANAIVRKPEYAEYVKPLKLDKRITPVGAPIKSEVNKSAFLIDYANRFDKVFFYDDDEQNVKIGKKVASLFPSGKINVVKI